MFCWEKAQDADLRALLKYINDSTVTNAVTKEIDMATLKIRKDGIISQEYVSMYTKYWDIRRDGEKRGDRKAIN